MDFLNRPVKWVVDRIFYISIAPFVLLLLVTVVDVTARYIFHTSFFDAHTLSVLVCLPMINWLALPRVTLNKEHVSVTLLTSRLSPYKKCLLDLFVSLAGSLLFFVISWQAAIQAIEDYKSGAHWGAMAMPYYPAKFVYTFGAALTAIVFLILFIKGVYNIYHNKE